MLIPKEKRCQILNGIKQALWEHNSVLICLFSLNNLSLVLNENILLKDERCCLEQY